MTLLEAFKLKSGLTDDEKASAVLVFEGLNPTAEWDPNNEVIRCAFYNALLNELSRNEHIGVKSIAEGGYRIEYDKSDRVIYLYKLAVESGCRSLIDKYNPNPAVENKSYLW